MNKVVGTSVSRKEGLAKVMGKAPYSAEHSISEIIHGYLVTSTIAKGRIQSINTEAAEQAPGVIAVFTHNNRPPIFQPDNDFQNSKIYESRLPLSDDKIHYGGQIIGLVVADTFERAREASQLIEVEYEVETPLVDSRQAAYETGISMFGESMTFSKGEFVAGNFEAGIANAAASIEAIYETATELHSPMEPHAIIAHWQDSDFLTVYEPSQFVMNSQRTYAQLFGISPENVRIVTPYIGGAFGSKAFPWAHSTLCAAVARELQRPLKLVVSRRQMTANTGHRSETEQTLHLAATAEGNLMGISHNARSCTSPVETFTEPCTSITPVMYKAPNLKLNQELGTLNVGVPTFMRAPGETPGMWAMESAMDELAWALNMDPVELRLKNETTEHQRTGLPFSAKYFADCLKVGSERFGWENRAAQPRAQQSEDGKLIGWGMAAASFPAWRIGTSVTVRLLPDGNVNVMTSGNDIGTGAYTMVAITAAEGLGISVDNVNLSSPLIKIQWIQEVVIQWIKITFHHSLFPHSRMGDRPWLRLTLAVSLPIKLVRLGFSPFSFGLRLIITYTEKQNLDVQGHKRLKPLFAIHPSVSNRWLSDWFCVELGDSRFPNGGMAGGSMMTASLSPAVFQACRDVLQAANAKTVAEACKKLQQSGQPHFEATASAAPSQEMQQWAFHSWGAHFCEVAVDETLGQLQITRWVSVINIGQVMNAKAAASQIRGGVIMGIGEALMEACHFDPQTGYPTVYDLATYHFPVHADIPRIDVTFVGEPDYKFNPLGVRGVGEIGITGVAPAVANAIYHATGKRLRSLPLTPDKLMA